MIRIKDVYVSLNNIKKMYFEGNGSNYCYMYIDYCYDDVPIKIEVDSWNEYIELADTIVRAIK